MLLRAEHSGDEAAIAALITAAFADHPHSDHTEAAIVARLRAAGALTLSWVAEIAGEIVGHVACSPVTLDGAASQWFGLGPLSVHPSAQRRGLGSALMRASISQLSAIRADGICLLGAPDYYRRFGFSARPELSFPGPPASHFLSLVLRSPIPSGIVGYHSAFRESAGTGADVSPPTS